jgi:hypothetical protein
MLPFDSYPQRRPSTMTNRVRAAVVDIIDVVQCQISLVESVLASKLRATSYMYMSGWLCDIRYSERLTTGTTMDFWNKISLYCLNLNPNQAPSSVRQP